jgi:hypothetical protein
MLNNNEGTLRDIYFDSSKGIAVSNLWNGQGGISRSTNAGVNWTTQLFTYALLGVDFPVTLTGYTVGANGTIMKSTDAGLSWIPQSSGTTANLTTVDFINTDIGYTAGYNGVILKTTNGGMVGIEPVSSKIPVKFYLYQNYPNPFNPSTKIKLDIPPYQGGWGDGLVKLIVYDILGKEITTLVNEELNPGTYEVEWDASEYPSGIYFYALSADGFYESKKLILIK